LGCARMGFRYAGLAQALWQKELSGPRILTKCSCSHAIGQHGQVMGDTCERVCAPQEMQTIAGVAELDPNDEKQGLFLTNLVAKALQLPCMLPCVQGFETPGTWMGLGSRIRASQIEWHPSDLPACGGLGRWQSYSGGPFLGRHYKVIYDTNTRGSTGLLPFELTTTVGEDTVHRRVGCDGESLNLNCAAGEGVEVHKAQYGQDSSSATCSGCEHASTCLMQPDSDVTSRVAASCNGKRHCNVLVCRSSLGFNCGCDNPSQESLQLQVDFTCKGKDTAASAGHSHDDHRDAVKARITLTDIALKLDEIDPYGHWHSVRPGYGNAGTGLSADATKHLEHGYSIFKNKRHSSLEAENPKESEFKIENLLNREWEQSGQIWSDCHPWELSAGATSNDPEKGFLTSTLGNNFVAQWYSLSKNGCPAGFKKSCTTCEEGIPLDSVGEGVAGESSESRSGVGLCIPENNKCISLQQPVDQGLDDEGPSVINHCISNSTSFAQLNVQCTGTLRATRCLDVMDNDFTSMVTFAADASITFQYSTQMQWHSLSIFRPPTAAGGRQTKPQNVWHFRVECFVGVDDTSTIDDPDSWHTLLLTQEAYGDDPKEFSLNPGWISFVISEPCPKRSDTWRISEMKSVDASLQDITLSEIDPQAVLDRRSDIVAALALPALDDLKMSITLNEAGTPLVTTRFGKAYLPLFCQSVTALTGAVNIPSVCKRTMDGNTNSPVVFNCNPQEDPGCEMMHITTFTTPKLHRALYMYYNAQHDDALHKRIANFSVECHGGAETGWTKVLDKNSEAGRQQFALHPSKRSQWMRFDFHESCESRRWRIVDIHNTNHHLYMFELKYDLGPNPMPVCTFEQTRAYDWETSLCLPMPLPPKVQGWCTAHSQTSASASTRSATQPTQTFSEGTLDNFLVKSKLGLTPTTEMLAHQTNLIGPPCASDLAVEVAIESIATKRGTQDAYATLPIKINVVGSQGENLLNELLRTPTKVEGTGWTKFEHIRGLIAPALMRKCRKSPTLNIRSSINRYWFHHYAYFKVSGELKVTLWWRPLAPEGNCKVSSEQLQYTAED